MGSATSGPHRPDPRCTCTHAKRTHYRKGAFWLDRCKAQHCPCRSFAAVIKVGPRG